MGRTIGVKDMHMKLVKGLIVCSGALPAAITPSKPRNGWSLSAANRILMLTFPLPVPPFECFSPIVLDW